MTEYNQTLGEGRKSEHITRNYLNATFDSFKRKKEAAQSEETMRQSIATESSEYQTQQ